MHERAVPAVVAAAVAPFAAVGAVQSQRPAPLAAALAAFVVASCAALAWRRVRGWLLVVSLAAPAAALVVLCDGLTGSVGWFGICVLVGWAAFTAGVGAAVVAGAAGVGVFVGQWLAPGEGDWGAWIAGTVFTAVACAFARRQRELVDQLHAAQAGLAERARAEERNRVAAEMHDVIGHALTVSLLHVSSARLALDEEPDEARASLAEAERLARESLDEVRAAVGLLRRPAEGAPPMPGGPDVPALVESFRRAGTRVRLDVRGDLATLGATRGLAVYRIVQESLTNAARHATGSAVVVTVDVGTSGTTVEVVSDAAGRPGAAEGSGVLGMRERAEALGGRLTAGPGPGCWRVEAVLPS